jgi:predicted glycosyl hydrolase (DUF1957 family)
MLDKIVKEKTNWIVFWLWFYEAFAFIPFLKEVANLEKNRTHRIKK